MASILKVDQIQESTTGVGTNFSNTGSASNPTISIGNQTNKGFYHIGTDKIGVSVGGVKVGEIGAGYGGFTGNIIQVQQTVKTNNFYNSGTANLIDVPGLSVSITPKYSTSKILVMFDVSIGGSAGNYVIIQLVRDSTNIFLGTDSKTYIGTKLAYNGTSGSEATVFSTSGNFLDSPNTVSVITYKIQARATASGAFSINRRTYVDDTAMVSSITTLEVQQ